MKRNEILKVLGEHRQRLMEEYSVKSLAVFGSAARDEATEASDVDLLVEFKEDARVGLFKFIELKQVLEGLLGCEVDLGTPETLRASIREDVLREAIRVA